VSVTTREVERAVAVLRDGGLVAMPTETVYGLAADAGSPSALRRLNEEKRRPADHPVIVHLPDVAALDDWAVAVPDTARRLADAWWPGPLTLVLRRAGHVLDQVTGGQETVGLRVPDQPVALALLRSFGGGLAAPSANRFGRVSPTRASDVRADLGADVDVVLDDGPCRVGVESTIVDCTRPDVAVLRVGAVPREAIEALVGGTVAVDDRGEHATRVPGALASHYAPRARVELATIDDVAERAAVAIARGEHVGVLAGASCGAVVPAAVVLGAPTDADEYAHELYRFLRDADARGLDLVLAVPPPDAGIGAAVRDRLHRAAAPRASGASAPAPVDPGER
jgi:L-threonylcarbamoyladenylate synthase